MRECLYGVENIPSLSERLMSLVIGGRRASMQDLRSVVGMKSREQVASDAARMALRTSFVLAGVNESMVGGGMRGGK